jgi:hypothetical protein
MGSILFLSLPAMILTFVVMRKGRTNAASLRGGCHWNAFRVHRRLAYTLACKNDGAAFVAIWYGVACVIMAAIGAVVGHRVLRW